MGTVYEDIDGNGVQDVFSGEMGLAGWTVQLYWNGQLLTSATTDADGYFMFSALGITTYEVCVVGQAGYTQTAPVNGTGCGGSGYSAAFVNTFQTYTQNLNFGMMLQ